MRLPWMFGNSEYLLTFVVSKAKGIFSSVGLEHYLDRVGVGGSSPPRFTYFVSWCNGSTTDSGPVC